MTLPSRPFPDPDLCKTEHVCADLFSCQAADGRDCPFIMSFGNGFFCQHPERVTFVCRR